MTLGQRIQEHRAKLGLSQESLGEQLGVSRQAVSKWEADAALPDTDKLIALSKLFGLTLNELLAVDTTPNDSGSPPQPAPEVSRNSRLPILLTVLCLILTVAVAWQGMTLAHLRRQVDQLTAVAVPPPQITHYLFSTKRDSRDAGNIFFALQVQAAHLRGKEAEAQLLLTDGHGKTYTLNMESTDRLWFRGGAVIDGGCPITVSVLLSADGEEATYPLIQLDSVSYDGSTFDYLHDPEAITFTNTVWQSTYDSWLAESSN